MEGLCFYFFQIPGNKQRVLNFMRDPKLAHILVNHLPEKIKVYIFAWRHFALGGAWASFLARRIREDHDHVQLHLFFRLCKIFNWAQLRMRNTLFIFGKKLSFVFVVLFVANAILRAILAHQYLQYWQYHYQL